jgi:hypothetical protein
MKQIMKGLLVMGLVWGIIVAIALAVILVNCWLITKIVVYLGAKATLLVLVAILLMVIIGMWGNDKK